MLFYTTPILGILTVFVAYVLLYRSSSGEVKQKVKMVKMNPPKEISLEEEVINEKAPIGKGSTPDGFIESSFKPVHDTILGGSLV